MARRYVHWDEAFRLAGKAIRSGAEMKSRVRTIWRMSGDCDDPYLTEVIGRPSALPTVEGVPKYWEWTPGRRHMIVVELWTRCHKCQPCCRANARMWAHRINYEVDNAPRTWYGTLTLDPASLLRCEVQAQMSGRSPLYYSGLEVTRYMKRVRHHATAKLRFVCVTETTSSGERHFHPHYHLLIHEQTRNCLKHRVLAEQWKLGFEKWRVVDPQNSPRWYLVKYLMKENGDRVRASILYGGRTKYAH